jgi:hypothetical protein
MDDMTTLFLSLVGALLIAAVVCLVFIFSRHGKWSFHAIPKLAKEGDRFAKAYLWFVYTAFAIAFTFTLISLFLRK